MPKAEMTYDEFETPEDYVCTKCGATGVRLWRWFASSCTEKLCVRCVSELVGDASVPTKVDAEIEFQKDHIYPNESRYGIDKSLVPLIPIVNDESISWGFGAAPAAAIRWWESLPNY